jgi:iron complex transport system permease protein
MTSIASDQQLGVTARRALALRLTALPALTLLLAGAFLANVSIGAVDIPPLRVVGILLDHAGIPTGITYSTQQDAVLWNIRLPRVLLALSVGGGLGIAGCALQGVFRNPLADPGIIGVSSGGAVAAIGLIVLGIAPLGAMSMPAAAFAGGLALTIAVYGLSRRDGRTEVVTLVLTGVAFTAIAGGIIGFLTFYATDTQLRNIVFWSLGSVGGATWDAAVPALIVSAAGALLLCQFGHSLNLLALGEREAFHLGVDTERVRVAVIVLAALVTGAAVAFAGIVGFVGLVVPHMLRLIIGPDHRRLLPATALLGASMVLIADLVARTIVAPAEMPLGVVTALAGGPYFLWLIHRTRRRQGGWA